MHCPQCGQKQISGETRFCSRCGFPLTGTATVIAHGGIIPDQKTGITGRSDSPRRRGIKQGAFLFMLTFLVVPILALIAMGLNLEPFAPVIAMIVLGVGGLLRMAYAMMFEAGIPEGSTPNLFSETRAPGALPPSQSIPASAYTSPAGSWRDTNDLQREAGSVTDNTTKLLHEDEPRQ